MKKSALLISLVLLSVTAYLYFSPNEPELGKQSRAAYADFINNHPFSQREYLSEVDLKKIPKQDRPDLAAELDFLLTMDPKLKRPAPERIVDFLKKKTLAKNKQSKLMQTPGSEAYPWEERGPNNVGGRTRALMFDPNDNKHSKVWAGGVTGGLWYNDSIYSASSPWISVSQLWENIPVSVICADPLDSHVFYVGTGEGYTKSGVGAGIWKTTDAGISWNLLANSSDYKIIHDLLVRQEGDSSVLYVASDIMFNYPRYGSDNSIGVPGLFKSTDGGINFTQITYNNLSITSPSDFELGADNTLWIATLDDSGRIFSLSDSPNADLVLSYNSTAGDRVELATAPSDSNYVYAVIELNKAVDRIIRTTDHGLSWDTLSEPDDADSGIPNSDFSRNQAYYNLIIQVDPNDKEVVIAGGIDLFRTDDGGMTWTQLSHWYGGFSYPYVHADQHNIIFKPGSSDSCLFANDGGVFYTDSLSYPEPTFSTRNKEYNVTQFYSCAINPIAGENNYIAGTQDNGTHEFTVAGMNSTYMISSGDGGYCFFDQLYPSIKIVSYVYNNFYMLFDDDFAYPEPIIEEFSGYFINPAGYDSKKGVLYTTRHAGSIYRVTYINYESMSIPDMAKSTHFSVSPYGSMDTSTIFIGTVSGQVFKVENASEPGYITTNLTSENFPNGSVSCIAIGSSDDELLVTFTNYGVTSVWYTNDGGDNWTNVEGDLPDLPVRWALFNPSNWGEVILATELGVWATPNIQLPNIEWDQTINGLENVRVNMLRMRQSDKQIVAATFGRGLFTSDGFFEQFSPEAKFTINDTTLCLDQTALLKDNSIYTNNKREWNISPNTHNYLDGTNFTSKNPRVEFTESGNYTILLSVSNTIGTETIMSHIDVVNMVPTILHENVNQDKLISSITGDYYQWYKDSLSIPDSDNQIYYPTENGIYQVEVEKDGYCKKESENFVLDNYGINNVDSSTIDIWFNQSLNSLNIILPETYDFSQSQLSITDTQGRLVYKEKLEQTEISMNRLSAGIYIALITKNNKPTAHLNFVVN